MTEQQLDKAQLLTRDAIQATPHHKGPVSAAVVRVRDASPNPLTPPRASKLLPPSNLEPLTPLTSHLLNTLDISTQGNTRAYNDGTTASKTYETHKEEVDIALRTATALKPLAFI